MKCFQEKDQDNPLLDRKDLLLYTMNLIRPAVHALDQGNTRLHISNVSSGAPDSISDLEGFSRLLWGLGAIKELDANDEIWMTIREGLIHGTNPEDPNYYGELEDYDQRLVETAAIAYCFVLRPEAIYEPLLPKQKENLIRWLSGINRKKAYNCNWKFFRVVVNIGLKCLKLPYDEKAMFEYLEDMESFYVGDGWYRDGEVESAHTDYYVPFAMHYYGLFYAEHMKDIDLKRAKIYQERARLFAESFMYWFDGEGPALPFGRSLTYRFAQVAFWSMVAVSGIETSLTLGQIKGIILRHFRWWAKRPIVDREGLLTLGYGYENQFMTEEYNAPGSTYWALKSMVILCLDESHSFWKVKEEPLPDMKKIMVQKIPRMAFARDENNKHLIAYNGGGFHTNGHMHVECKYEKFAYSTYFGFSVPRSHKELRFGAYDSMLALSEDGLYYRHKNKSEEIEMYDRYLQTVWTPFHDVKVKTTVVYGFPWHVRIHQIETGRSIFAADGGFAFGLEQIAGSAQDKKIIYRKTEEKETRTYPKGMIYSEQDISGIEGVEGFDRCELITAAANTNLMNSRTVIPTLQAELKAGCHTLVSLVYGDVCPISNIEDWKKEELPIIEVNNKVIRIMNKADSIEVDLS